MSKMRTVIWLGLIGVMAASALFYVYGRAYWVPWKQEMTGKRTVAQVVAQYGEKARAKLAPYYEKAQVAYPGKQVALLAVKAEKRLALWAQDADQQWHLIREFDVKAASGVLGPKLREGDRQVPEGIYRITWLHPNSTYHLSMKLNYPNEFDWARAKEEGRQEPGSNIFIHGKAVSIGCLAMGDEAIEQLFVLASDIGIDNISVVISPTDPRMQPLVVPDDAPDWTDGLYQQITQAFLAVSESQMVLQ
ncbi:hypothetical protein VST7929_01506 [Vibrio stylophorae]|uniref:L,D-TPase catalytic domain-containing protein n=1 Tax=Vibrio stylophorae TaxID=659351 RepID=A0ABN8DV03_9VIBR|nr:L,D-transpeptidase family protein [Vibrio stylophorae]CAH0533635.1 hypothetical protein VST7929_01506 [Vibrio stylophorae]